MDENYDWNKIAEQNKLNNPWGEAPADDGYDLKELIDINRSPILLTGLNANTQSGLENQQAPDISSIAPIYEAIFPNNAEMFSDVMHGIGGTDENAIARWWSYQKRDVGTIIYALDSFMVVKSTYQTTLTNVYVYDCDKFEFKHLDISDNDIFGDDTIGQG